MKAKDDRNQQDNKNGTKKEMIYENSEFLYMLSCERLKQQFQQIDALDGKIISLLGFSCTLVAILAAAIAIIKITAHEIILSYVLLAISVLAFIFIAVVALKSYFTKPWHVGPNMQEAWNNSEIYERAKMFKWAADSFTEGYDTNKAPIHSKVFATNSIVISLIFQIVCQIAAITLIYVY